jgi:hypothetical protein
VYNDPYRCDTNKQASQPCISDSSTGLSQQRRSTIWYAETAIDANNSGTQFIIATINYINLSLTSLALQAFLSDWLQDRCTIERHYIL